jgi:hypothetical protein
VRLRVLRRTDGERLCPHVHRFTETETTTVYTDEWKGYNGVERNRQTVCHSDGEWARDDDGDGTREVHVNTVEGLWTTGLGLSASVPGRAQKALGRVRGDLRVQGEPETSHARLHLGAGSHALFLNMSRGKFCCVGFRVFRYDFDTSNEASRVHS